MFGDRVAMRRSRKQGAKDQEIEGALEDLDARLGVHSVDTLPFVV
jgi:hypothetical protein